VGRPVLLDLCCKQGGAAAGYAAAGFDVIGVDCDPQPRFPFTLVQADALVLLDELVRDGAHAHVAAIHASPPCQAHSRAQVIRGREHPDLIGPLRDLLTATGLPYVIENVPGAPLLDPVELCGVMFGLHTYRHRWFESNVPLAVPLHPRHVRPLAKMGRALQPGDFYHAVGNFITVDYVRDDMGVPWMTRHGIREAIPPAYARYIGGQLMTVLPGNGATLTREPGEGGDDVWRDSSGDPGRAPLARAG
jgi:DNA (cytosine-5)-methyltransferase 1